MNCTAPLLTPLLDAVVGEFEAGRVHQGVLLLAGILDAAVSENTRTAALRQELADHPLRRFLAAAGPIGWSESADSSALALLAGGRAPAAGSRCGQEIAATVLGLGFARALQDRGALGREAVSRAWRRGGHVALIDSGQLGELAPLAGMELGNFALAHADPLAGDALAVRFALPPIGPKDRFDLILASGVADSRSEAGLAAWLGRHAQALAPGGTLVLSSFVPGHLGFGWQTVCLAREPTCHDPAVLERCAQAAGLTSRTILNAAGSLVWAELGWPQGARQPALLVPSGGT